MVTAHAWFIRQIDTNSAFLDDDMKRLGKPPQFEGYTEKHVAYRFTRSLKTKDSQILSPVFQCHYMNDDLYDHPQDQYYTKR